MKAGLYLLTLWFMAGYLHAQNWKVIYPQSEIQNDFVKGLIPPGGNFFYAVGNDIIKCENYGSSWRKLNSGTLPYQECGENNYFDLQFITASTVVMVFKNNVYVSKDTGTTWSRKLNLGTIHPKLVSSSYFNALHFPTQNTGYAVGSFSKIFKTTDRGETWDTLSWSSSTAPYRDYSDVYFFNEDTGIVSGYEVVDISTQFGLKLFAMKTTDGGGSWKNYPVETTFDFKNTSINFLTEKTGFIFCSVTQLIEKIFVTNDSAKTWSDISPQNITDITCVKWIDSSIGILYGRNKNEVQTFYKTTNQGQSWYEVPLPITHNNSAYTVNDFVFLNGSTGFTVGKGGAVMRTLDGGESWQVVNESAISFYNIEFTSKSDAYGNTGTELYKTTDGGHTWIYMKAISDTLQHYILDFKFNNTGKGYFLGYNNVFYKTTAESQTIVKDTFPVNFLLFYQYMQLSGDTIYIAGSTSESFNLLLSTFDDGTTWTIDTIGVKSDYLTSFQLVENTLIVTTPYNIMSSSDYGSSWDTLHSKDLINHSCFLDKNVGYANINNNDYIKTDDRGKTWKTITIAHPEDTNNLHISGLLPVDKNLVYAYGNENDTFKKNCLFYKSGDGGSTWQREFMSFKSPGRISKMFKNDSDIYAVSSQGQLLCLDIGRNIIRKPAKISKSKDCKIFHNPVSDVLIISNPETILEARVYTLNGDLLSSIKTHQKKVSLQLSHLPAGVYICSYKMKYKISKQLFCKIH